MPDTKITALTAIGANPIIPSTFPIPMVDLTDTSMAASGTTKKVTVNQILGAGGTATLASATITGDLTVDTSTLKVDSANNRVGIGTASPAYLFDVLATGASTIANSFSVARITGASAVANDLTLVGPNTSQIRIMFSDTDANGVGEVGYDHSSNRMRFVAGGNEQYRIDPLGVFTWLDGAGGTRMTLNATGLGVGVASPATKLDVNGGTGGIGGQNHATFSGNAGRGLVIGTRSDNVSADRTATLNAPFTGGGIVLQTQGTDRLTLDSSGNLLVARTSAGLDNTSGVTIAQSSIGMQTEGNAVQLIMNRTTSDGAIVGIRRNNLTVGDISVTTTGTTYNTISDYRLKESVQPLVGGLARISALKPSVYKWKSDGSNGEGFLAHELAEVVPLAVTGEKDAVNDDGSIKAQGVDLSKVVPILVAAIQELTARVQTLETR